MTIETNKRRLGKASEEASQITEELSELIEPFLEDRQRRSDDHRLQATTVRSYRLALKTFAPALVNIKSEDELRERVRQIIDEKLDPSHQPRPMKESGVNVYIRGLNAFFSWCKTQGAFQSDIKVKRLRTPRRQRPRTIGSQVIDQLKGFSPSTLSQLRAKCMALTVLDTGLRAEECLLLKESDIEWTGSRVWAYTKGQDEAQREVALSSVGKAMLRRYLVEKAKRRGGHDSKGQPIDRYVFGTSEGGPMSYRNSLRDLKQIGVRLGIGWASWHTFRRTFATQYVQSGGLVTDLQEILGHADLKTTLMYLGSSIDGIVKVHDQHSALAA
ncbi:MAG TPA: site-specific integrase [Paludibaculum sp.]|jgi:site-specific recombinase XerD